MKLQKPTDRIKLSGDLPSFLDEVCGTYALGKLQSHSTVDVGYEDCNFTIETTAGKFFVKAFAYTRSPEDIRRYVSIMTTVIEAGIHHPKLKIKADGNILGDIQGIQVVVMDFIAGNTYLELDRIPNQNELGLVVEQAAKIHSLSFHPPFIFDSWAIPNISAIVKKVDHVLDSTDRSMVLEVLKQYESIPIDRLPKCFVHGDFTKANILKGDDGRIYVLDFSVANVYPRIQELAVIAANLLHEKTAAHSLRQTCTLVAEEYGKFQPLTSLELEHLYQYALTGVAMELLGAYQEKYLHGNDTKETAFWMELGRTGLQAALEA